MIISGEEPNFAMLLAADDCKLIITSPVGKLYEATFEMAYMHSRFSENGEIIPVFFHQTKWDENGNCIGREDEPTIASLRLAGVNRNAIRNYRIG